MKVGVDFHDTLSYNPEFFKNLFSNWPGKRFIISGTPENKREETIEQLKDLDFIQGRDYDELLLGFNYEKGDMDVNHFNRMKDNKLKHLLTNEIQVFFDDNPYYVENARHYGILAFQTILSPQYIEEYSKKDKFFTCHLQERQFNFLTDTQTFLKRK